MWIPAHRVTVNEAASGDAVHQKYCERRREDRYANRDEAGDVVCKFVHCGRSPGVRAGRAASGREPPRACAASTFEQKIE
jgi:hypothetical protein